MAILATPYHINCLPQDIIIHANKIGRSMLVHKNRPILPSYPVKIQQESLMHFHYMISVAWSIHKDTYKDRTD